MSIPYWRYPGTYPSMTQTVRRGTQIPQGCEHIVEELYPNSQVWKLEEQQQQQHRINCLGREEIGPVQEGLHSVTWVNGTVNTRRL